MKKLRVITLVAAIIMMLPTFAAAVAADSSWAVFEPFEAVTEPMPAGNLLSESSFDDPACVSRWNTNNQTLDSIQTESGGYLRMSDIALPYLGFQFKPSSPVGAGTYKFTGYFRTSYEGEVTQLRFFIHDKNDGTNGSQMAFIHPKSDGWLKVELYVVIDTWLDRITVAGGPYPQFIQSYCVDNFSLEKVDEIPDTYNPDTMPFAGMSVPSFGTPVNEKQAEAANNGSAPSHGIWDAEKEAQYDVQGIMLNRDIDFIGTCISAGASVTEKMLKDYVYQYEGTHVTDYMICLYNQVAVYPSEVATDFLDQYYYYKNNPQATQPYIAQKNDMEMAYIMFERKKLDFVEIFCETFSEIGINPWLTYRMNDAHEFDKESMPFFNDNPQYRRFQHPSTTDSYYQNILDYTHEEVRDHMLAIINESLSMYDCYGIELDFQREIRVWHMGGEYAGLDILTDFVRQVDAVVKVYEEKYGHEIKVALRCASDIQTNYDFGLDVITWAAEGLIDIVNPTSRWHTTDFAVPVRLWTALMHPYGVEVVPGFDGITNVSPDEYDNVRHTLQNMCAGAASWFSQGADKLYLNNYFLALPDVVSPERRITTGDNHLDVYGDIGYMNMLTTIGSYEKVVNRDRRMLIGYNDIRAPWKIENNQLPLIVTPKNTGALYIPLGDIPQGAKITFNFSVNSLNLKTPPQVCINGQPAKYLGSAYTSNGFTTDKVLSYEVPASAYDDTYIVAEITAQKYLLVNYADLFVEVAE